MMLPAFKLLLLLLTTAAGLYLSINAARRSVRTGEIRIKGRLYRRAQDGGWFWAAVSMFVTGVFACVAGLPLMLVMLL
ncbi:MAG: hypothetical protein WCO11_08935 [Sphingomonadales bacterium]|jgi:hypothetical protein